MVKKIILASLALFALALVASAQEEINSFEDCLNAGNPVMESYPRQCVTSQGIVFIEEIDNDKTEAAAIIAEAEINDEEITASDLQENEPRLLPTSRFYFVKNWWRQFRLLLVINPTAEMKLREKFANQQILEIKEMVEQNADPAVVEKALGRYMQEQQAINQQAARLKENAQTNKGIRDFSEKYTYQQILHYRILEGLENQVPEDTARRIREQREKHLETFRDVMLKLEGKEQLPQNLENALERVKGNEFKAFREMEFLDRLEEKMPEDMKERIREMQEKRLKMLQEQLKNLPEEAQSRFGSYIENLPSGQEIRLRVLENVRAGLEEGLGQNLEQTRNRIMEQLRLKQGVDCPLWTPCPPETRAVSQGFDENGCPLAPQCIETGDEDSEAEQGFCITIWDPVCGEDGKTYSNSCFAGLAGVEIRNQGVCPEENTREDKDNQAIECQNYWWFDNQSLECREKAFCGAYMYQGLQTFETQGACEQELSAQKGNQLQQR